MKKPQSLKGVHGRIKIKYVNDLVGEKGESLNGQYDDTTRTISICDSLDGALFEETLLHEFLHAILLDASGDSILGEAQHEWVVGVLSRALIRSTWKRKA